MKPATEQTQNISASPEPEGKPSKDAKKVGLIGLVAIVISAMVGGGVYNLPQNMAEYAATGPILIAWAVTAVGMWFLANTFRVLSAARPDLTNGLYTYAEDGFGKFIGFFVAYGYWICNCFALVAYSVLIMETVNDFLPYFAGGNNIPSILAGSVITWVIYLLTTKGARQTSFLNIIGTLAKLVPLAIFLVAIVTLFKFAAFAQYFWGSTAGGQALSFSFANVMPQVRSTMMVTLWLFIGIEGAVVVSGRATSQAVVRRATVIGLMVTLILYVLVSSLPLGVYTQSQLASMASPSVAAIMLDKFGLWGEILMNVGVIISVLSSWLVWMLMLGEMPLAAAQNGTFPKFFNKENKHSAPVPSLLVTTIVIQAILVFTFFAGNAWDTMITITSVMSLPCYLLSTLFLCKILFTKKYPSKLFAGKGYAMATGIIATVYALWLLFAAGLNYLMMSCIIYAVGIPLYIVGRKQSGVKPFAQTMDKVILGVMIALGVGGIIYMIVQVVTGASG